MNRMTRFLPLVALVALLCACLTRDVTAQSPTDSTPVLGPVTWRYTDSVAIQWAYTDSVAHQDTTGWTFPPPVDSTPVPPVGMKLLTQQSFDRVNGPTVGPVTWDRWNKAVVVADPSRGPVAQFNVRSGTVAAGTTLNGGSIGANAGSLQAQRVSTVDVSLWIQRSPGYIPHPSGNKYLMMGFGPSSTANQFILTGYSGATIGMQWQGTAANPPGLGTGGAWKKLAPGFTDGWHLVRILIHCGPGGTRTSSASIWLDGASLMTVTGFDIVAAGQPTTLAKLMPVLYWGGLGGTLPRAQWVEVDDLTVYGAP